MDRVGWTVTFEGKAWTESDLTVADAAHVLEVAGGSWVTLHPLASPDMFAAILAQFLHNGGENFDEALIRVSQIRMVAALEMVTAGEAA